MYVPTRPGRFITFIIVCTSHCQSIFSSFYFNYNLFGPDLTIANIWNFIISGHALLR